MQHFFKFINVSWIIKLSYIFYLAEYSKLLPQMPIELNDRRIFSDICIANKDIYYNEVKNI